MSNVIGMNEFVGMANGDSYCWICQKPVSTRALFCHLCGTIQPVRNIDYFARLGLERRLDVPMDDLERQYNAIKKSLDPERFASRGLGERGHATKQLEALTEAYETLRDPMRRGRYWLLLNQMEEGKKDEEPNPIIRDLHRELVEAVEPGDCDRVAQKAGQALEQGVVILMQALRGSDWKLANVTLHLLDGTQTILDEVRDRRKALTGERE